MKKLLVIAMVLVCGFLSSAEAQLPGNPANPHGTLIDRPGVALAKWERDGNNLYWMIDLTTPTTFIMMDTGPYPPESYVEFWGSNSNASNPSDPGSPYVMFPGSMNLTFDAVTYPYGSRVYYGTIDLSNYDDYWTNIQADYSFYINEFGDTISDSVMISNEELGYPW
jgi:hypothetical protein